MMTNEEARELLSDIRAKYNCFNDEEEPYYQALSRAIVALGTEQLNNSIDARKVGEWDMFELLTSVWHGKQYYFKQDNDMVYSRASCKTMPVQDAIKEFMKEIDDNG